MQATQPQRTNHSTVPLSPLHLEKLLYIVPAAMIIYRAHIYHLRPSLSLPPHPITNTCFSHKYFFGAPHLLLLYTTYNTTSPH